MTATTAEYAVATVMYPDTDFQKKISYNVVRKGMPWDSVLSFFRAVKTPISTMTECAVLFRP